MKARIKATGEIVDVLPCGSQTSIWGDNKKNKLYNKWELDNNHVDGDNDWALYEAMDGLEDIFGKELFNETEE